MDLKYMLEGIKDGTVTIYVIDKIQKKLVKIADCVKPSELETTEKFSVVELRKDVIADSIDYCIKVEKET